VLHVILHNPQIPPNTGNVIRLCANTGASLHLIRPLGFEMDHAKLRRAGLDYHEFARVAVHDDLDACFVALNHPRTFAFTARGDIRHADAHFERGDALLFGCETSGLPDETLDRFPPERRVRLPMVHGNRSVNLSNAVAVAVYEAWRQLGFAGGL
jgi:tRNA (cytidine/uridine-2'-O-)-methyltransferase